MGLISLYLFTLLGGLALGLYIFETCFTRVREGVRPWLIPLITVVLFAVGLLSSLGHVHSFSHGFSALAAGTINFASGMVWEVAVSVLSFVLILVDLILTLAKKTVPFAYRGVVGIVALVCVVLMGAAYTHVLGNPVWCNTASTLLIFTAGSLAMGLSLYVVMAGKTYADKNLKIASLTVNAVLALGIILEIAVFSAVNLSVTLPVIALIVAPVLAVAAVLFAAKFKNAKTVAIIICIASLVGVTLCRYAFYASWSMM